MTTDLMQDATPPPLQTKAPAEEGTDVGSGASMDSSVKKPPKEEAKQDEQQLRDQRGCSTSSINPGISPADEYVEVGSLTPSCTGSGNA
jgi:hypothetical protein